ncbi:MAG: hypothetical protein MUC50_15540 [Myxococcota bacterium]|nr:hypothetical protein [Myxococcota bacterium]
MSRVLSYRVEVEIPSKAADSSDLWRELNDEERRACRGLPLRSLAAAAAAKRALVALSALAGQGAGADDFGMRRQATGGWQVIHWPASMAQPLVSVAHSRCTATALAACEEQP